MSRDTDNNYRNFHDAGAEFNGLTVDPRADGFDPAKYDDICKLSAATGYTFRGFKFLGGGVNKEDGLDLNRGSSGNLFSDGIIEAGRGVAITCKGGSSGNLWRRVMIRGRGRFCDIELGNHSDQSWVKCSGNILEDVMHEDGRPVRVAYGRSERPIIQGGHVRIVWWWTAVLHLYTYAKHYLPFIP